MPCFQRDTRSVPCFLSHGWIWPKCQKSRLCFQLPQHISPPQVLPPPAGYVPIRTPARKLSATPTPIGGMTGFHMQAEDRTTKQMNDQPSGNLPFLKPDDIQYFDKLLVSTSHTHTHTLISFMFELCGVKCVVLNLFLEKVEVDESTLSPEEQKERKIMKLLLKIKNGTPPMRKVCHSPESSCPSKARHWC